MAEAADLVLYSSRKAHLIEPLVAAYEAKTGLDIEFTTDKAAPLIARLEAEGEHTPADMLITVDAGNLWSAAQKGVLSPVDSPVLEKNVPEHLQDPENRWFGLSLRARTIVYNTDLVDPAKLSTYEALGDPAWKGKLLLRTSKKVYNQSLVAALIAEHGEEKTEEIVRSWVANLAAPPFSSDTKVIEAVEAGVGAMGVVNTYYFGRYKAKNPDAPLAVFWPNQESTGVHVNVSGAGIVRHAPHREAAVAFLEWLSSAEAQNMFADANKEYPVNPAVEPSPEVAAWGDFKADSVNVAVFGEKQADAIQLMDRAGYK
jgi:iron(III) transport system substrate-binding protein